jgi:hypothetical protein
MDHGHITMRVLSSIPTLTKFRNTIVSMSLNAEQRFDTRYIFVFRYQQLTNKSICKLFICVYVYRVLCQERAGIALERA